MEWTRKAVIGRGSSATVSLAAASSSGELFAVKSTELSGSKFLQTEQEILSKLNSPYLVKYLGFDITRENSNLYYNLFMEYLPRGTLFDEIQRHGGRLEEAMIRRHTWEILQGLEYLHGKGLAHCDIKSTNILMGKNNAKISDLGCAKFLVKDSQKVVFSGTPMFMSPEVVLGQDQGFESDIWALGCTVIEMATGKNPWPEVHDPISALYRIGFSGDSPGLPSSLSRKGKDFLEICLKRDPKKRMTAKELLKHPFFEGLKSESEQVKEFVLCSSPRSVCDQSVWDSSGVMGSSSDHEVSSFNSAASRIERLIRCDVSADSSVSNWSWDEDWVTVRNPEKEESENVSEDVDENVILADEFSVVYGVEMSFLGVNEIELASSMFATVNVTSTVSVNRKRGFAIAFETLEDDVVCRNLKFKEGNENLCSIFFCNSIFYFYFFLFFLLNFTNFHPVFIYFLRTIQSLIFLAKDARWIMIFLRWCEL